MRLTELRPKFFVDTHEGRQGLGVNFDCPHCVPRMLEERQRISIPFANPLDGGRPPAWARVAWQRSGETFEDLTLTPSIDFKHANGGWHGFITNGEMVTV